MKYLIHILFFLTIGFTLQGQNQSAILKGHVSFVSNRNVYVKFKVTESINIGDTLFIRKNNELIPALVVSNKSSTSTVCTPLLSDRMRASDEVICKTMLVENESEKEEESTKTVEEEIIEDEEIRPGAIPKVQEKKRKQKIRGRLSASSYSNLSDYKNSHRMRYAFSFKGEHLNNSRFSTDNQISFRHTLGEWGEVQENLNNALKVYSLSAKYDFTDYSSITVGRKINHKIASMGAIDGFQYEHRLGKSLFLGAIAGTRPDYSDYSLSFDLPQLGGYINLVSNDPTKYRLTTLGFIEQRNKAKTDRRLVYFQHSGDLVKNLNMFASFEIDLYENINNEVKNVARLTNLYLSLRYRFSRKLRISASYDNRKNIIYYESYKNFIDRLIEQETRQGLRFGISYRPFKFISWGLNTSLRFQKSQENVSRNINTYVNISRIPILKMRATVRANFLETSYLRSKIFGVRFSKQIIKRKLSSDLYYRMVDYHYLTSDRQIHQTIAGASLSWRVLKKLTLYLYYEGTFNNENQTRHRINTKLIQRF